MDNYEEYYNNQLRSAQEYQDFVMEILAERGIHPGFYTSRKYQYEKGESIMGIEVKHDLTSRSTGNLYIELVEKSHTSKTGWSKSGIFRDDNTKTWLIGNYCEIYWIEKAELVRLYNTKEYKVVLNKFGTSKGMLLPQEIAAAHALHIIRPANGENNENLWINTR